jgi:hypothetical protein
MLVHVIVCWNCRDLRPVGSRNSVRRTGIVFFPRMCCVMLPGSRMFFYSGQLVRTERRDFGATEESECDSSSVAGERVKHVCSVRAEIRHFHS